VKDITPFMAAVRRHYLVVTEHYC